MPAGAFEYPVLDSSIFHIGRPCEVRDFAKERKKLAKLSAVKKETAPDPLKDRGRQVWGGNAGTMMPRHSRNPPACEPFHARTGHAGRVFCYRTRPRTERALLCSLGMINGFLRL
jgi:hypothetical protein